MIKNSKSVNRFDSHSGSAEFAPMVQIIHLLHGCRLANLMAYTSKTIVPADSYFMGMDIEGE